MRRLKSIVNEQLRDKMLASVERDRQALNQTVESLRALNIVEINSPDVLPTLTVEWARRFFDDAYQQFMSGRGFVPESLKNNIKREYDAIAGRTAGLCNTLQSLLAKHHFALKIDSKQRFWFDSKDVNEWATSCATRRFTDTQKQYYTLVGAVVDALNDVARFEREHGLKEFATVGRQNVFVNPATGASTTDRVTIASYLLRKDADGRPMNEFELNAERFANLIDREQIFRNVNDGDDGDDYPIT